MEIAQVIAVRDALKAGKNLPLTIYIDNAFRIVNENNVFQFTKWDDNNGVEKLVTDLLSNVTGNKFNKISKSPFFSRVIQLSKLFSTVTSKEYPKESANIFKIV